MGTTENESAWSTSHATNANADAGINWAEGQDAASANDSARAMMAARAKARLDQGGGLAATGTANALVVATNQGLTPATHLAAGLRLLVLATADNTSTAVTLAVDGATPASIKRNDGTALAIGDIKSSTYLDLAYHSGASEWRATNISAQGAGKSSFSAHNNGTTIAPGTTVATKMTWSTLLYNVGGNFASSQWTPPAGTVVISAALFSASALTAADAMVLSIYKNGSPFKLVQVPGNNSVNVSAALTMHDQAVGTDIYAVYVTASNSSYVVSGVTSNTFFMGAML